MASAEACMAPSAHEQAQAKLRPGNQGGGNYMMAEGCRKAAERASCWRAAGGWPWIVGKTGDGRRVIGDG